MDRQKLLQHAREIIGDFFTKRTQKHDWRVNARPEQLPPEKWSTWLVLAGRGFGKTRTAAETVRDLIMRAGYRRICLLGETMHEVRAIMVEGKSGLLNIHPNHERPKYYPSLNAIVWKNGATAHCFSGENTEALRGPEFDLVWIDELAKFPNPEEALNQVRMTMRIGEPKLIITTTPKPIAIIKKLAADKNVFVTRGSTMQNAANLPEQFIDSILEEYGGTKFGLQEIYGEIVDEDTGNLWYAHDIKYEDVCTPDETIIAVDPAVTYNAKSDETGIVVVARRGGVCYVLEDASLKAEVLDWASVVVNLVDKYNGASVVIENNQGGNLARELILQLNPRVAIHEVRASKSKLIRAQPIAMQYRRGRVMHARRFEELEKQMIDFMSLKHSPDRVDALIWGITHLQRAKSAFGVS